MKLLGLGLAVVLGVVIRSVRLFSHATMPDEAFTFFIAAHPLPQILPLLQSGDFHPPLLYLIGHGLFHFTTRAYLFRVVSVFFGAVGIAATYWLASMIVPRFAFLAALLVAISPALVFFDRFFRMYAMVWALCMLSWALLQWAFFAPRSALRWSLYALTLIVLLYTQYLAFFTLAAQLVYALIFHRSARGFWLAFACACIAFIPWIPTFLQQYPLGGTAFRELSGHWEQVLRAPSIVLIDSLPPWLEYSWITAALMSALIAGGIAVAVNRRQWLALGLITPIVLQVGYSAVSGKLLLGQRYLLQGIAPSLLLIFLLVDWLLQTRTRVAGMALTVVLPFMMVVGTVDELFLAPYQPINWTEYGQFLEKHMQPHDAVVFDSSMVFFVLIGSKPVSNRPVFMIATVADVPKAVEAASRYPRVWYVDYQSHLPDPHHAVFDALVRAYPKHTAWRTVEAGYGDVLLTVLFERQEGTKRAP